MSKKRDNYNKNLSPMVLPKETLDYLMSQPDCLELIPVYVFYYYYSLWTSKRVTVKLITRKLKMGRDRVRRCKRRLLEIGLLTQTVLSDDDQNRINQQVVIHCSPHWPSGGLPTRPSWPSGVSDPTGPQEGYPLDPPGPQEELVLSKDNTRYLSPQKKGGFFRGEEEPSFSKKCSIRLSNTIRQKRKVFAPINITNWTKTFDKLNRSINDISRVKKVLKWYCLHMGEPYVPVAYSAETFRNKFLSIEDAMKRSEPQTIEVSNTAKKIYSKIKDIHWPWDKDVLLLSIQTSIDNYNDYVKLHKKVLRNTDQKELKQFSRRFYEEVKDIEDFMVDWWGRVGRKISFISLPPSPAPFVFSIESKDFQSMGHMVSCKWSGDNDLWIEYRDLLYAYRKKRSS